MTMNEDRRGPKGIREAPLERRAHGARELMDGGSERTAENDVVHVVLGVYDPSGTYSRHAGVVMASIFEKTRSSVCVHILHDRTLTDENRDKLQRVADIYAQEVRFEDVSQAIMGVGDTALARGEKILSRGALFRILIPSLLSEERVIYLDCDVLVNLDVRELWDVPLEGRLLAGALDYPPRKAKRSFSAEALRLRLIGSRISEYVNSGVLLMDLRQINRELDLAASAAWWYPRYGHQISHADQDFINSLFRGRIKILEDRFNKRDLEGDVEDAIVHAIRHPKPWEGFRGTPLERLYWNTYLKTPWGKDQSREALIDLLIGVAARSPLTHRHTGQCYGRVFTRLWRDILCNDKFSILWVLLKEGLHCVSASLRPNRHRHSNAGVPEDPRSVR